MRHEKAWDHFRSRLVVNTGSDRLGPPYDFILEVMEASRLDPPRFAWTAEDDGEPGNFFCEPDGSISRFTSKEVARDVGIPRLLLEIMIPE